MARWPSRCPRARRSWRRTSCERPGVLPDCASGRIGCAAQAAGEPARLLPRRRPRPGLCLPPACGASLLAILFSIAAAFGTTALPIPSPASISSPKWAPPSLPSPRGAALPLAVAASVPCSAPAARRVICGPVHVVAVPRLRRKPSGLHPPRPLKLYRCPSTAPWAGCWAA